MEKKEKIYESPDGGKTIYERDFRSVVEKNTIEIDGNIIINTPNDTELGARVRKLYWQSKGK